MFDNSSLKMFKDFYQNMFDQAQSMDFSKFSSMFDMSKAWGNKDNFQSAKEAGQIMNQNAKQFFRLQSEMMTESTEQMFKMLEAIYQDPSNENFTAKHKEYAKYTMQKCAKYGKDVADLASKAHLELFEFYGKQAQTCGMELKKESKK